MSIWLCIPSARPLEQAEPVLRQWAQQGYRIALFLDPGKPLPMCDLCYQQKYPGYAAATNLIAQHVMIEDDSATWLVFGGDDILPDPNHTAQGVADQCEQWFSQAATHPTFGVMQPTGDRWGDGRGAYIDRVAGSPWVGREFARRVNQGNGPLWPEYFHMGEDEELQAVATKLGVYWQRPDLTHYHQHWGRGLNDKPANFDAMPEFLTKANSAEEWRKFKTIFQSRQAAGFPGHEPIR